MASARPRSRPRKLLIATLIIAALWSCVPDRVLFAPFGPVARGW